ncbi:DUF2808 domain-containing protein [Candidatus Atelocyanobacterium thalassae]|uniref:DUF2808 domain-containing protein n=1 Tax=cyanobacterium endosymbiont of Braarudosphaera bigelowii TaxID=1285375 RepID=A0ABN6JZK6_9CHRO|nr:DUF2808 domain-containing protein [Candidatus Atelocyanobacterium thalassa]BDA39904.1 hypothetical protein CPARK_000074400 [cyanobacterium endosymbiont of Braarudosphaera bigelowii]
MNTSILQNIFQITGSMFLIGSSLISLNVGNNIILFNKSPRLIDTTTSLSQTKVHGAQYYFVMTVPLETGVSLQKVVLQQIKGVDQIYFNLDQTVAFIGKPISPGDKLPISKVQRNLDNNKISITFKSSILPGETFFIVVKPKNNPVVGGNYQFGITVYPEGKHPQGLYIGAGALNFRQHGNSFP